MTDIPSKLDLLLTNTPSLPTIPQVAQEVIHSLDDEHTSTASVAGLIAADQVLSVKVLRVANSAYYAAPRTISTIPDAIALLGFSSVRSLVISASLATSFRGAITDALKPFWRYSLHTAVAARYLAGKQKLDRELAFTVGLIHGIGRIVMHQSMLADLAPIDEAHGIFPSLERMAAERTAFGFDYADVGHHLARRWNFPNIFCDAILGCADPLGHDSSDPLHAVLFVACWLARASEHALAGRDSEYFWPQAIGELAGVEGNDTLTAMPPLHMLSAGLDDLISA